MAEVGQGQHHFSSQRRDKQTQFIFFLLIADVSVEMLMVLLYCIIDDGAYARR
jgi:hypothetical protein